MFTAVTMRKAVFWDVRLCACCKNPCLGGTYRLHHQGDKNRRARNKMNLAEMGLAGVDWIGVAQDRDKCKALVNAIMNYPVR
jgi:hypothetical protein